MLWSLALLLASTNVYITDAVDYKLDGNSYIVYSPSAGFSKTESTLTIHLLFRTAQPSGVLLHARETQGNFLSLEIVRGKLRYVSVFGKKIQNGTVGDDLGDDQWHQVDIIGNILYVDVIRKRLTAERMQNYQNISVAGLPLFSPRNTSLTTPKPYSLPPVSLTGLAFKGCMEDVTVNDNNIFKMAEEKSKDIRVLGKLWPKCPEDAQDYPPATLSKSTSYIQLETVNGDYANLNFRFRTFDHTGVLVHYSFGSGTKQALFLELINGKLMLKYAFQNLKTNTIISPKYSSYADGLWHNIRLNFTSEGVAIRVNNETTQQLQNRLRNLFQNTTLTIGTSLKEKPSMKGCVREIQMNGKYIKITRSHGVTLKKCYLTDLCFINPCLNQGVCQQHNDTMQCDCTKTGYYGSRCQKTKKTSASQLKQPTTPTQIFTGKPMRVISTTNDRISTVKLNQPTTPTAAHSSPSRRKQTIITRFKQAATSDEVNTPYRKISTGQPKQTPHATMKPSTIISKASKIIPTSGKQSFTEDRKPSQTSKPSIDVNTKKISTVKLSENTQRTSVSKLKQPTTPTQIFTGKPKRVISTTNKTISTIKLNQPTTPTAPYSSPSRRKQTIITQFKQAATSDEVNTPYRKISTGQPKQTITPFATQIAPPSTKLQGQPTPSLTLYTHHSILSTHRPTRRGIPTTTMNSTDEVNTRIIITKNSSTEVGFNQNQLLVYLFLFIVFFLFVGLIVIISVKLSNFNACPCIRRFQTVNGSLTSQDSIELGHQQRKDSNGAMRVKSDRPSSVNDSGIDRSESGTDSNRSSAEVQEDDICDLNSLGDNGGLVATSDDPAEGFLIFQEDPSLYTQKSFGWTILSSSHTLRHCRTSTRDLIHAANENKPRVFLPEYYATNSELSDDVRLDADDDVSGDVMYTRHRNPTTKYRQLTTSDSLSLDNASVEETPGLEGNELEECPVF